MGNKKIIELDAAPAINSDALFAVSEQVNSDQKTVKGTVEQIGDYIAGQQTFSSLNTTSKKLIGAINEAVSGIETALITPVPLASFADGGKNIPLKALKVLVTAVQAGTGTPSPSNVRAISGWSGCDLSATGKNLAWLKDFQSHPTYFTVNSNGTVTSILNDSRSESNMIPYKLSSGKYTISRGITSGKMSAYYHDGTQWVWIVRNSTASSATFTLSVDADVYIKWAVDASMPITFYPQIERGETETTFEAFGTTHNIPFNTTVYGGVLDVLSGVLTVTHGIVDLGTLAWGYDSTYAVFTASKEDLKYTQNVNHVICTKYATSPNQSSTAAPDKSIYERKTSNNITGFGVKDSTYTDTTTFTSAVSGTYAVYELATPTTIQLTPTEVKTILGQNNIFGDCGDIDTLIYFNNNANEISDLVVAYVGDITNLYATLATGNTSVTITNPAIKTNSTIDIYCDPDTLYNSVTVTDGQIVIAFDTQESDVKVKVRVS